MQVEKADLEDTDLVVGLLIGGVSRAYPVRLLSLHEVVNDRVGDRAIAVTWCTLCYSAVVFDQVIEGEELSFRASGYLLHDNLVLIDHPTDTLWSQLLGQGIKGARRGKILNKVPSTVATWGIWRESYRDITRDQLENGMIDFESLTPVPAQLVYWFAWTGFYPESNLY